MALLNYHELTMNEPRDSPARRKQFLVICTVMASVFFYSTITSGLFTSVTISKGTFPGGTFVYKTAKRDYAAAPSLQNQIGTDLGIAKDQQADKIYTIYLDDPAKVSGGRTQRFASGFLAQTSDDRKQKNKLMDRNREIQPPTRKEVADLAATDLWPRLRYKQQSLPKAKAAVVNFPYTNGFVSALMHSFKVMPKLRKHAETQQRQAGIKVPAVTIITTCSIPDQMCTHYAPLEKVDAFLLGQPRTQDYVEDLPKTSMGDSIKGIFGLGGSKVTPDEL